MSNVSINPAGLRAIAEKLDALDAQLADDERDVLVEIFRLAGDAAGNPEVAAFGLPDFDSSVGNSFGLGVEGAVARTPLGTSFLGIFVPTTPPTSASP